MRNEKVMQIEKLNRDIETLLESIKLNSRDLASLTMSNAQAAGIRENTKLCIKELSALLNRLPTAKSDDGLPPGHRLATPDDFGEPEK
jgi:hypothetical protein